MPRGGVPAKPGDVVPCVGPVPCRCGPYWAHRGELRRKQEGWCAATEPIPKPSVSPPPEDAGDVTPAPRGGTRGACRTPRQRRLWAPLFRRNKNQSTAAATDDQMDSGASCRHFWKISEIALRSSIARKRRRAGSIPSGSANRTSAPKSSLRTIPLSSGAHVVWSGGGYTGRTTAREKLG